MSASENPFLSLVSKEALRVSSTHEEALSGLWDIMESSPGIRSVIIRDGKVVVRLQDTSFKNELMPKLAALGFGSKLVIDAKDR